MPSPSRAQITLWRYFLLAYSSHESHDETSIIDSLYGKYAISNKQTWALDTNFLATLALCSQHCPISWSTFRLLSSFARRSIIRRRLSISAWYRYEDCKTHKIQQLTSELCFIQIHTKYTIYRKISWRVTQIYHTLTAILRDIIKTWKELLYFTWSTYFYSLHWMVRNTFTTVVISRVLSIFWCREGISATVTNSIMEYGAIFI